MSGPDAPSRGVNTVVEKPTSLYMSQRSVESASAGKTMFEAAKSGFEEQTSFLPLFSNNNLEEATSFVHKFRNLNKLRAKDSRRDLDSIELDKIAKAAFSVQQIGKIEQFTIALNSKRLSQSDMLANIKKFVNEFSQDFTQQSLALMMLRDKVAENPESPEHSTALIKQIDGLLERSEESREFQAGVLGYSVIDWAERQGFAAEPLKQALETKYPIDFSSMSKALENLRQKFGDDNVRWGTAEIYKQLSSRYHNAGRGIDKLELAELMKNMSQLKSMLAIFDECKNLASLISPSNTSPSNTKRFDDTAFSCQILQQVTHLQNKSWVEQSDITKLAADLGVTDISDKNVLGVQLRRIISLIPEQMFAERDQKQQSMDVLFQFVDMSAKEEAGYANMG